MARIVFFIRAGNIKFSCACWLSGNSHFDSYVFMGMNGPGIIMKPLGINILREGVGLTLASLLNVFM